MTKLITEDNYTSSFLLRLFEPYLFTEKYGPEAKLILAKRIIEQEFGKIIDFVDGKPSYSNFMRKQDSIAVVLYVILYAQLGEQAHNYLLPAELPNQDKLRIKSFYGLKAPTNITRYYQEICQQNSGPIEDSEYDFFKRVDDLFTLPFNINVIRCNMLQPLISSRMKISEEKTPQLVSTKHYLEFDIAAPKYELHIYLEQEIQKQISFLQDFFKLTDQMVHAEEVSRTLQNMFNFFFQKIFERDNLRKLIEWEFNRLQLAKIIDSTKLDKADMQKLVTFLLDAKPNPRKNKVVTIPESKAFPKQLNTIFEFFKEQKCTLNKAVGQIFTNAQLYVALGKRYERQTEITEMFLKDLEEEYKKINNKTSEKALEIKKAKTAAENGLKMLAHTEDEEAFKINHHQFSTLAIKLAGLEQEIFELEGTKQPVPPELRLNQKLLKTTIEDLQKRLTLLEEKLSLYKNRLVLMPLPTNQPPTTPTITQPSSTRDHAP